MQSFNRIASTDSMDMLNDDSEDLLKDAWDVLKEDDIDVIDPLGSHLDEDRVETGREDGLDEEPVTPDIHLLNLDDDNNYYYDSNTPSLDLLEEKVTSTRNGDHQFMTSVSYFTSILSRTGIHGPRHLEAYNLRRRAVKIGNGSQFTVYKELSDSFFGNEGLVIKRVNVPLSQDNRGSFASGPEYRAQLRALELEVLALCNPLLRNHRNIVHLIAWGYDYPFPDTPVPALFMEAALMTLADFLKAENQEPSEWRSVDVKHQLALDVTSGIEALHRLHIVHGDVKPDNVLVFKENHGDDKVPFCAKISDFGVCIDMETPVSKLTIDDYRGTPVWLAPEVRDPSRWGNGAFKPEVMFRFDAYSLGLVILSIFINQGEPVDLNNAGEDPIDVAIYLLREEKSIPSQLRMQLCKALRGLLAEDQWKRTLPSPDLLSLDTPAFSYWLAISQAIHKNAQHVGTIDPAHNKGPLFWYRLDPSVLKELEQQFAASKADKTLRHAGDVLFGMAQNITGAKPSYLDRLLTYVSESARCGYSPATAVYAQIMHAHGEESEYDDQTLDRWLLQAVAEGYLFPKLSPRVSDEHLEMARQKFRDSGGFCTDPFTRKPDIMDIARDKLKVVEWQTSNRKVVDNYGNTILHVAAALGAIDVVRWLVEKAHVPVDVPNDNSESPLYKACQSGQGKVIHYLLDKGARASTPTRQAGLTALHWLFTIPEPFLRELAIRLVREAGASVNAMMVSEMGGNGGSYPQRLSMTHFPFELPLGTPFHWAAFARNKLAMEILLELGADINARYHDFDAGTTPLALASWHGEVDIVKFLLSKGANGTAKDSKGRNTLHFMTFHLPERHGSLHFAWHYWIRHGNWDEHLYQMTELTRLLTEGGADIEALDQVYPQHTPIVMASAAGVWDGGATCALLSLGADVNDSRGAAGDTVLHQWAYATGGRLAYPNSYLYVVEQITAKMYNVDIRNEHAEETPLHVLVSMYHSEYELQAACETLFAHEPPSDVNMADRHGLTPLYIALNTGQKEQDPERRAFYLIGKGASLFGHTGDGKDILYQVATNKTLSDQQSHNLIFRLLSHLVEQDGGDVRLIYQKYYLPRQGAVLTLNAAVNAGRVKTAELLLDLGLERDINKPVGVDSSVTVLDDALSWAERSRQMHIDLLAAYSPGAPRERALTANSVYDPRQGSPSRAAEAYLGLPDALRLLRARGAKRACELKGVYDSVFVDIGLDQPDVWDITQIYWMGFSPETQPNRGQWEIAYELSRLPSADWRDHVIESLRQMYEDDLWRPDLKMLEDGVKLLRDRSHDESSNDSHNNFSSEVSGGVDVVNGELIRRMLAMLTTVGRHDNEGEDDQEVANSVKSKADQKITWIKVRNTQKYGRSSASSGAEIVPEVELVVGGNGSTEIKIGRKRTGRS